MTLTQKTRSHVDGVVRDIPLHRIAFETCVSGPGVCHMIQRSGHPHRNSMMKIHMKQAYHVFHRQSGDGVLYSRLRLANDLICECIILILRLRYGTKTYGCVAAVDVSTLEFFADTCRRGYTWWGAGFAMGWWKMDQLHHRVYSMSVPRKRGSVDEGELF